MQQYPILFLRQNKADKHGNISELTMDALRRETQRLFKKELKKNDVEFYDESFKIKMEENDDLEDEYDRIMDSDSDNESDSDSDSDSEDDDDMKSSGKRQPAIKIRLRFILRNIDITPPIPTGVHYHDRYIKATTAVLDWKLPLNHNLSAEQISSLEFEVLQQLPKIQNGDFLVAKCNPLTDQSQKYMIKLHGLLPKTDYQFKIRSVLYHKGEKKISGDSELVMFKTTPFKGLQRTDISSLPTIPPPSDLQVVALYPDRATLAWNHVTPLSEDYDFEYLIYENDYYGGQQVAGTEDENMFEFKNLTPSTQYSFIVRAKYYDPERKLSDAHFQKTKSAPSNILKITTPEKGTTIQDFETRTVEQARWRKDGHDLELMWSAPETFYGRIQYEILDGVQKKVLGTTCKVPVVLSTGERGKSMWGEKKGSFIITVRPIFVDDDDEKVPRVEAQHHDIEITIDNEKKDTKPEGHFLDITVRLRNQELDRNGTDRRTVIDIRSCDFQEFQSKILEKLQDLQLDVNKLKISMLIPSFNGTSNDRMDVGGEILWRSFIDNHSRNFIGRRSVICEVETIVDAPDNVKVSLNQRGEFVIDFNVQNVNASQYDMDIQASKDSMGQSKVPLNRDQMRSDSKPIVYSASHERDGLYFRFRVKCKSYGNTADSGYSPWTPWTQYNAPAKVTSPPSTKSFISPKAVSPPTTSPLAGYHKRQGSGSSMHSPRSHTAQSPKNSKKSMKSPISPKQSNSKMSGSNVLGGSRASGGGVLGGLKSGGALGGAGGGVLGGSSGGVLGGMGSSTFASGGFGSSSSPKNGGGALGVSQYGSYGPKSGGILGSASSSANNGNAKPSDKDDVNDSTQQSGIDALADFPIGGSDKKDFWSHF